MGFGRALVWQAPRIVTAVFPTNAAILTAPNCTIFIADGDYRVEDISEVHETLGTDGAAVSVDVLKCTGTQAASAGVSMLSAVFSLKSTINTVVRKNQSSGLIVSSAKSKLQITKGDRIALNFAGTLTAVTGVCIQVVLKPILRKQSW